MFKALINDTLSLLQIDVEFNKLDNEYLKYEVYKHMYLGWPNIKVWINSVIVL